MITSIENTPHPHLDLYTLRCGNSSMLISRFGAQMLSWSCAEKDILYTNPTNLIDDKSKPLRAGAPVCFPWFNKGLSWNMGKEISPSHGPARSSEWEYLSQSTKLDSANIAFSFSTESALKLPLKIEIEYALFAKRITCSFKVNNLASSINPFELALHTYFTSPDPAHTKVIGLKEYQQTAFIPQIPIDKIFENLGDSLVVDFAGQTVNILNSGFRKSVIWHPGTEHSIADLPKSDQLAPFFCIESLTEKIEMGPGAHWQGSVSYSTK